MRGNGDGSILGFGAVRYIIVLLGPQLLLSDVPASWMSIDDTIRINHTQQPMGRHFIISSSLFPHLSLCFPRQSLSTCV